MGLWSLLVLVLGFCFYVSFNFLAAYSACSSSLQSSLVQFRLVKTNLFYSSQIQLNLAAVGWSVGRSTCSFLAAYSACSSSFWPSPVWSRLVQTNLVYSSQIQSNLDKSRQIQSNLEKSFLGYFWQHIAHVADLYSSIYYIQCPLSYLVQ